MDNEKNGIRGKILEGKGRGKGRGVWLREERIEDG